MKKKNEIMKPTIHTSGEIKKNEEVSIALIEQQLEAYNKRDIEAFLKPFSEDVKAFGYPDHLRFEGKEQMRSIYTRMFDTCPNLHCKVVSRTVSNDTVIDKELITGMNMGDEDIVVCSLAIYKIESNKISEIRFISHLFRD